MTGISSNRGTVAASADRLMSARQASVAMTGAGSSTRAARVERRAGQRPRADTPSSLPVSPTTWARATARTSIL